jgi:hypothetical protein
MFICGAYSNADVKCRQISMVLLSHLDDYKIRVRHILDRYGSKKILGLSVFRRLQLRDGQVFKVNYYTGHTTPHRSETAISTKV